MILSDSRILESIENKSIVISPFDIKNLGSNSYDVHLGNTLLVYNLSSFSKKDLHYLDPKLDNETTLITIPEDGYVIYPLQLYLGVTKEYTECHDYVPFLDGKSSIGRLGINIHATAGVGDIGFCNHWTLEIYSILSVKIYPGMPIGQLYFHTVDGKVLNKYNEKQDAKYNGKDSIPVSSKMFKNKF